jgi:hypothetical protein
MTTPYRDRQEALDARVASLEAELAAAHERIARLESRGRETVRLVDFVVGGDLSVVRRRRFAGTLAWPICEAVHALLIERYRTLGRLRTSENGLVWSTVGDRSPRDLEVVLMERDGDVALMVKEDLSATARAWVVAVASHLGAAMCAIGIQLASPVRYLPLLFVVLAWLGVLAAAAALRAVARRRVTQLEDVAAAIERTVRRGSHRGDLSICKVAGEEALQLATKRDAQSVRP